MKIKNIILISFLLLFIGSGRADATSLVIEAPSSANVSSNFNVTVKHSGETIGSMQMAISITNAECSVQSTCSGGVANCNGGSCLMSFNLVNGLKAGSNIITLSCHSNGGTAKFNASISNKDAWDVDGMKQLSVGSATKSVVINGTTSTTKKTTTKTTISKRSTTGRSTSTKSTTTKTTTKKISTNKATSSNTTKITNKTTASTQLPITTDEITSEVSEEPTTFESTTPSTTVYVPDDLKLKELKIVGYNINFKPNLVSYTIDVDESVDELYIIAEPADGETEIDSIGLVNITNKDFIQIRVHNENAHHEINYKINIRRTKKSEDHNFIGNIFSDGYKLIILSMVGVIFVLIVFFTFKALLKRESKEDDSKDYSSESHEVIPTNEEELKKLFDELDKKN